MRFAQICLAALFILAAVFAQDRPDGPTDEKAQKTYKDALKSLHENRTDAALEGFRKADKQDGGHCTDCQRQMLKYGSELRDWKTAELAAEEMIAQAQGDRETAVAHYEFGVVLMNEGLEKNKEDIYSHADQEFRRALAVNANFPDAIYGDGKALAHLRQDEAARAMFEQYTKMKPEGDPNRQRALRYTSHPELARALMAPPFAVTTVDGKRISMDDLQGKVVLLDFWATWCEPCREALPHIQNVAKKFQGQPLVILSVSLDSDEQKWKDFIQKNKMTWLQYRDGSFKGSIAQKFGVTAIPHTFTIDADGVLQEEHIGDASIEGKINKLLARARELQTTTSSQE
ncbi:MAG TPA: TlpA disulfide reductase family protein [Candidatus Acidoferrales bacterium]|nr:TlpA disulfide reductase family protein [Candidatus Acidoferrales bacterium]